MRAGQELPHWSQQRGGAGGGYVSFVVECDNVRKLQYANILTYTWPGSSSIS